MRLKILVGGGKFSRKTLHHLAGESLDFWAKEEAKVLVVRKCNEEEGSQKGTNPSKSVGIYSPILDLMKLACRKPQYKSIKFIYVPKAAHQRVLYFALASTWHWMLWNLLIKACLKNLESRRFDSLMLFLWRISKRIPEKNTFGQVGTCCISDPHQHRW